MKVICSQENLSKALNIVSKAISTRASLPIISNVLLETLDNKIALTATDLETTIRYLIPAVIKVEGKVAVPAKMLSEFVAGLTSEDLELGLDKLVLSISSGSSKAKFNCMSAEDFPVLPEISSDMDFRLNSKTFFSGVLSVAFCAALDDAKPVLNGVLINYLDGKLYFVCTDGFRLSEKIYEQSDEDLAASSLQLLVPARILSEAARMFNNISDYVSIKFNTRDNLAFFEGSDLLIACRIIDGDYPDYKRIVPSNANVKVLIDAQGLFELIKLANVFAKESSNVVKLEFDSEKNLAKVSSRSDQVGEGVSELACEIVGESITVSFNSKYLLDFFNNHKNGQLEISLNSETLPVVFRQQGVSDYYHLIMPVKTNS